MRTLHLLPGMEIFDMVDEKYQNWELLFNYIVEEHMATTCKKMRFRKTDVPYMTSELRAAIKMKRKYGKGRNGETRLRNIDR